jgi:hypothetical protein
MAESKLPHTDATIRRLRAGQRKQAIEAHNKRVRDELARAQQGEPINLSDLMAANEEIALDDGDAA